MYLTRYTIDTHFDASTTDSFWKKIVGKGEVAPTEKFLLFPHCLLLNQNIFFPVHHILPLISLFAAELEEPNIGIWVTGLISEKRFQILALFENVLRGKEFTLAQKYI